MRKETTYGHTYQETRIIEGHRIDCYLSKEFRFILNEMGSYQKLVSIVSAKLKF